MKRMKSLLEEARSAIQKSWDNMVKYYNWHCIPALVFKHGDKVFLDSSDIYMTCLSAKLLHYYLRPYMVEKQVRSMWYHLKLPPTLWRLYLVFQVVKLTTTSEDPISRRYLKLSLDPVIVNREKEWKVEKILNSHWQSTSIWSSREDLGWKKTLGNMSQICSCQTK